MNGVMINSEPCSILLILLWLTVWQKHQGKVEVADNGLGVAAHAIQQIFVPFYTTSIGLAISIKIVSAHGGVLEYSRVSGMARF